MSPTNNISGMIWTLTQAADTAAQGAIWHKIQAWCRSLTTQSSRESRSAKLRAWWLLWRLESTLRERENV